jgi:hypothetical protein
VRSSPAGLVPAYTGPARLAPVGEGALQDVEGSPPTMSSSTTLRDLHT